MTCICLMCVPQNLAMANSCGNGSTNNFIIDSGYRVMVVFYGHAQQLAKLGSRLTAGKSEITQMQPECS